MIISRGLLYAFLSGVFLSTGGLVARYLQDADPWTVLFYRSIIFSITVAIFLLIRYGSTLPRQLREMRPTDAIVSICLALGFVFYLLSLYNTTVANTVLILSTGPFFAAVLGWLVLREAVHSWTWAAMAVAIIGVAVMVSGGVSLEDARGMIYAVIAILVYAIMLVTLRRTGTRRDLLPATALAGLVAAVICLPFIDSFALSTTQFLWTLCFGSLQVGCGFILVTLAARTVPAAQVALLGLSETALAPLWVWLFVNEIPSANTLMGGSIILLAVVVNGIVALRRESRTLKAGAASGGI